MKWFLLCMALFLIFVQQSFAQGNQLPNQSFEGLTTCPDALEQINRCSNWTSYTGGTPDYYHYCGNNVAGVSIPSNWVGYQLPKHGDAYIGLIAHSPGSFYREYITTSFSGLNPGLRYELSMSVSLANKSNVGSNNLGAYFFKDGPTGFSGTGILPLTPQINFQSHGVITDTSQWKRINGYFIPDSAYTNVVIGGFFSHTGVGTTIISNLGYDYAYYYIDSVALRIADTIVRIMHVDYVFCAGDSIKVDYLAAYFDTGNKFKLQISDQYGNFANGLILDSIAANGNGTIKAKLPPGMPSGNLYRVRIIASSPVKVSDDNGFDIHVKHLPIKPNIKSNGPICEGSTLNLMVVNSTQNASYTWAGPGGYSSTIQSPARNNAIPAWSGQYIVSVGLNGCYMNDTLQAVVNEIPDTPLVSTNSPICAGGEIKFTASNGVGLTYEWHGPNLFYSNQQNPSKSNVALTDAGDYSLVVKKNNCISDTIKRKIQVVQGPSVVTYPNPGDTICTGWDLNLVALPTNAGSSPTYEWFKNGNTLGVSGVNYKASGVTDGDTFFVLMTAGTVCNTPISSTPIRITVLPAHTPPTITVTPLPGAHVWPGLEVTFKAKTGNAGAHPGYQWRLNGHDISNAKDSVYITAALKSGDTICCVVTSNFLCASPRVVESNCVVMNVDVRVEEQEFGGRGVRVYPNPNNGTFVFSSSDRGVLAIYNLKGQQVRVMEIVDGGTIVSGMPKGVYVCKFMSENGRAKIVKVVVE